MDVRRHYREGAVAGASPVELIIRLYEQIIDDLRQAARALDQNNIELRTAKINHAILVIGYLESQLNLAGGGVAAENLRNFYRALRANLVQAQFRQSKKILDQQISDLLAVREAWILIERPASAPAGADPQSKPPAPRPNTARLEWNG
jgi:flagellar secretion chaperone FliS